MELMNKFMSLLGYEPKGTSLKNPNTIENLKLLMLENLDLKKTVKLSDSLLAQLKLQIENDKDTISNLGDRVIVNERQLDETTKKPLNMDQVAAYLNYKGFKYESDKGDNVWRQKPQPKSKPKKKINWEELELSNNPHQGLKAKLKLKPKKTIKKEKKVNNFDLTKAIKPTKL